MFGVTLKCLGSSSAGNCYIIESSQEALILECGIPMAEIKEAVNWNINKFSGCFISHRHGDHSKYLTDVASNGIRIFALHDVLSKYTNSAIIHFCRTIKPMHGYKVDNFKVFVFDLQHADNNGAYCPCVGFIVEHPDMGKLLFATDTMMLKYRFKGINHILIEANYSDEILEENIRNGIMEKSQKSRLLQSHLELQQTAKILKDFDLSEVQNIVLLHLSSRNSDASAFKYTIQSATGLPTSVAGKGMTLNLTQNPY